MRRVCHFFFIKLVAMATSLRYWKKRSKSIICTQNTFIQWKDCKNLSSGCWDNCSPSDHNKKLCYGRRTARRACQCRKKLAIDEWPWHIPNVITVAVIKMSCSTSLPVCGLLFQCLYLGPFSRHYHFWSERDCLWPWELLHIWQWRLKVESRK